MAEQIITLFSRDIQKNLFPEDEFYKQSKVDGGIDPDATFVEIPQSGSLPGTTKNETSFPLTAAQRTDNTLTYSVDAFNTDPTHLTHVNELTTNYSKRQDILEDHIDTLNERIAKNMAEVWHPATNTLSTTGSDRATGLPGATGNRKALTYEDLVKGMEILDRQDVSSKGRFMMVTPSMYADLLKIDKFIDFDFFNKKPVVDGSIGQILGMTVFKRSNSTIYSTGGTKKLFGASPAVTDNESCLIWQEKFVRRAEGKVKVFARVNDPLFLGDIFNAIVRNGGTPSRTGGEGVINIMEAAGA